MEKILALMSMVLLAASLSGCGGGDPSFANVSLLLHMNGTNGSTTFTDTSPSPKTVTPNNGAQISTAQSQFGGASAFFDGADDFLQIPNSADFTLSNGDFTVEAWVYATTTTGLGAIIGYANGYLQNSNYSFLMLRNGSTWQFEIISGTTQYGGSAGTVTTNQWLHTALVRSGANLYAFVGGTLLKTTAVSTLSVNNPSGAVLQIGRLQGFYPWSGYIDELRFTKGVARYTSTFTPPTAPFPDF